MVGFYEPHDAPVFEIWVPKNAYSGLTACHTVWVLGFLELIVDGGNLAPPYVPYILPKGSKVPIW